MPLAASTFFVAAIIAFVLSPAVARFAVRIQAVSPTTRDRWHRQATPTLGGVAIAAGTLGAVLATGARDPDTTAVASVAFTMLVLGLVDDRVRLRPTAKLVGSLAAGAALVFFLSGIGNRLPSAPVVLFAVAWFAGIVHALNLLDNMDGLAAGIAAIIAVGAAVVAPSLGAPAPTAVLSALAGALVGFLPWNTSPARMFMGDTGSLFIGAALAGASLVSWFGSETARPFTGTTAVLLFAELLLFSVPLGEVVFVSLVRWMAGRNPTRGGVDHPSHRLVAIGLSERRAVLVLYAVTCASVATAVWTAQSGAAAIPAAIGLIVALSLGAIQVARVPTYQGDDFTVLDRTPYGTTLKLAFLRSHAVQVLLDLVLITVCYYEAYRLRFEDEALDLFLPSFTASLPIVLICKPIAHYVSGLYGRSWSAFGVGDLPAVSRAVILGTASSVVLATYVYRFERFSRGVFIIDATLLLLVVLASRLSFRMMSHAVVMQSSRAKRVLICGTGERGRLLAREMLANTAWGMKPVGFVDADGAPDQSILGIRVVGSPEDIGDIIRRLNADEVLLSGDPLEESARQQVLQSCAAAETPVRELLFGIVEATPIGQGSRRV